MTVWSVRVETIVSPATVVISGFSTIAHQDVILSLATLKVELVLVLNVLRAVNNAQIILSASAVSKPTS